MCSGNVLVIHQQWATSVKFPGHVLQSACCCHRVRLTHCLWTWDGLSTILDWQNGAKTIVLELQRLVMKNPHSFYFLSLGTRTDDIGMLLLAVPGWDRVWPSHQTTISYLEPSRLAYLSVNSTTWRLLITQRTEEPHPNFWSIKYDTYQAVRLMLWWASTSLLRVNEGKEHISLCFVYN